jgi:hypothetical protein
MMMAILPSFTMAGRSTVIIRRKRATGRRYLVIHA